ncbi:hypothetical protein [Pseudomonas panipatensis]|jgi:hypothetical protein|uniref:DUF5862 domain-containing protein n=1 Tax=Pseudomonas panipatensis TaxID=428992 RepID=A0A1G8FJL9_9PSED|nr:hypothetical protein [Pseudomonas panipatensis]SDH82301.1 hypothetical protein SAMN05216272_103284 [Pseudomonas panipatensis]SMP53268.1 hypothetical protein SAMN06295951_103175 [Pseudomonas panipatensis]
MQELNMQEVEMVAGGVTTGFFDSIGGAILGTVAGAMGAAWRGATMSLRGGSGIGAILNPVAGIITGAAGTLWGAVFGLVNGLTQGSQAQVQAMGDVWNDIIGLPSSSTGQGSPSTQMIGGGSQHGPR